MANNELFAIEYMTGARPCATGYYPLKVTRCWTDINHYEEKEEVIGNPVTPLREAMKISMENIIKAREDM